MADQGMLGRLGIGAASPVDKRLEFVTEALILDESVFDGSGIRGSRSHDIARQRLSLQRVFGPIRLQPNAVELSYILEWILGGSPTGSGTVTYPLANTLPTKYVTIDRGSYVYTIDGAAIDSATFRGSPGEPLTVDLNILGKSVTPASAGTFPAISFNDANGPFMHHDLVATINSSAASIAEIQIMINNYLDRDRFFNSRTLVSAVARDRQITGNIVIPHEAVTTFYGAGGSGVAVVGTWTNGGAVLTMTMPKFLYPKKDAQIQGRQEIMLPINGTANANGATPELTTTLNVGP